MAKMTLSFPGVSKETLEEKLKDAMIKFELSAEYEDGKVTIFGTPNELKAIKEAYLQQKMIHDIASSLF